MHRMEPLGLCGQLRAPPAESCGLCGLLPSLPAKSCASFAVDHKQQKRQNDEAPHPNTPRAKRPVETRCCLGHSIFGGERLGRFRRRVNNEPLANQHQVRILDSVPLLQCVHADAIAARNLGKRFSGLDVRHYDFGHAGSRPIAPSINDIGSLGIGWALLQCANAYALAGQFAQLGRVPHQAPFFDDLMSISARPCGPAVILSSVLSIMRVVQ